MTHRLTPVVALLALLFPVCFASSTGEGHDAPAPSHDPESPAAVAPETPSEESPDDVAKSLLVLAKRLADRNDSESAETAYIEALNSPSSQEVTEDALFAYAEFLHERGQNTRAAATYESLVSNYPSSPKAPLALIELGRTLRDMGAFELAKARFYAVLNSTLVVSGASVQRYQDLAQVAKFEIAETYYQQGDYAAAGKFFGRIKLLELPPEQRARASFREAYSFFLDGKLERAAAGLRSFVIAYPGNPSEQEARYLLCLALRRLGRTQDALTETLALLRIAQSSSSENREQWTYWQRRTGNQLANDFYEQGDYTSALTIYQTLAELRSDPVWRWPALYQIGLCYERLSQPERAALVYQDILSEAQAAQKVGTSTDPMADDVRGMAEWRLGQIEWTRGVESSVRNFTLHQPQTRIQ